MANTLWFRLYTDITRDRKLRRLNSSARWVWIAALCIAKESPVPGTLLLSEGVPAKVEDIADEANISIKETESALQHFKDQFMIADGENALVITNWNKRQFVSDSSTERVKKHRETKLKRFSNGEETPPDTDTDTDTDKNKKSIDDFFESIWSMYPRKEGKGQVSKKQKKVLMDIGLDEIQRCVSRYIKAKAGTDKKYLQHGSTFFNSGYVDYLDKNYSAQESEQPNPTSKYQRSNYTRSDIEV